jgi:hypothetical protein
MTPREMALVALDRAGKLDQHLKARHEAREKGARQAEFLASVNAQTGGRQVPGSAMGGPTKVIYAEQWHALSDEAKNRFRKSDEEFTVVFQDARGRTVPPPPNFDPMRD